MNGLNKMREFLNKLSRFPGETWGIRGDLQMLR